MKQLLDQEQREELIREFPYFTNKELSETYGVSVGYIKQFGYKYLLRKCKAHLSAVRALAQRNNKKYNMETTAPIEKVTCITRWLRTFSTVGDTRKGQLESAKKCHSVSVMLSRWNVEEGRDIGIKLHAVYDKRNAQVTVTATNWNEEEYATEY